jgi:hypothetical protein
MKSIYCKLVSLLLICIQHKEKGAFAMNVRVLLLEGALLAMLYSFGCATAGHDYDGLRYYPGYYPPEYPYLDYDPFHPYYSNPSGEPREKTLEKYQKSFEMGGEK